MVSFSEIRVKIIRFKDSCQTSVISLNHGIIKKFGSCGNFSNFALLISPVMIDSSLIKAFKTISLEEMGKVRLMNRVDTKFVTSFDKIQDLLRATASDYMIQEIGGRSNMPYYTRYYDTDDTMMFYEHQRGRKNRQKIRVRHYEDSDTLPFIEIKTKNNKGRTYKRRIAMDKGSDVLSYDSFINQHSQYDPSALKAHIENHFYRITLVNKEMTERITIDTNLEFHNLVTDLRVKLGNIGIVEWKRDGRSGKSGLDKILRDLRIHPRGFSKYCVGMAITNPHLRQNRLKKKLRFINRINPFM